MTDDPKTLAAELRNHYRTHGMDSDVIRRAAACLDTLSAPPEIADKHKEMLKWYGEALDQKREIARLREAVREARRWITFCEPTAGQVVLCEQLDAALSPARQEEK